MLKVGLTGGIGSGKTTVAEIFSRLNVPVIDSDVIAHQLTLPGSDSFKKIVNLLGEEFLTSSGELDRTKTAQYIFKHLDKKKALEEILHPQIKKRIIEELKKLDKSNYAVIVVPLLFETNFTDLIDRSLVVNASKKIRTNRIKKRDGTSEELIQSIINSQIDSKSRTELADDVLDNSTNIADLELSVKRLHDSYVDISNNT